MQKWIPPRLGRTSGIGFAPGPQDVATPDGLRPYIARPVTLVAAEVSGRDIGFCAELAAGGGAATSSDGFTNERELFRLHEAGLLDLYRQNEQPFLIVRICLSQAAHRLVDGARQTPTRPSPRQAGDGRRQGFEVARAMFGAAVKSELAGWCAASGADVTQLERRLLTRIGTVVGPFAA